jgi:5-formyltetrahydrofolate cyclo-ligase
MIDKASLRAMLRQTRAHAHANCPGAGALLAQHLPLHLFAGRDIICAGYLPIQTEIDPKPAMAVLAELGADLALPRRDEESGAAQLHFHLCNPFDAAQLEARDWSLMEPKADQPRALPNVVLVPLLGFDRQGHRLGYGMGYYDQALTELRQAGAVLAIGLAFSAQEVAAIPIEAHDQPLDWIVTEKEAIEIATLGATCG